MTTSYHTDQTAERNGRARLAAHVGKEENRPWPGHAWPGHYPIAYIADDGGQLCGECMNVQSDNVHFAGHADGWRIDGAGAYGADMDYPEDGPETCDHCGRIICDPLD